MNDFPQTPEAIDRTEKARAQFLAIQAKRNANKIRAAKPYYGNSKRQLRREVAAGIVKISLKGNGIGFCDPIARGDVLRRRMLANAERLLHFEREREQCKILVKDGKALTPKGEELLRATK